MKVMCPTCKTENNVKKPHPKAEATTQSCTKCNTYFIYDFVLKEITFTLFDIQSYIVIASHIHGE